MCYFPRYVVFSYIKKIIIFFLRIKKPFMVRSALDKLRVLSVIEFKPTSCGFFLVMDQFGYLVFKNVIL